MGTVQDHEFRYTKKRLLQLAEPGLSIGALAVPLFAVPESRAWGLPVAAGAAAVALMFFVGFGGGVAVAIDADGLACGFPGFRRLSWSAIDRVRFVRVGGVAHLVVDRTAAARAARRGGFLLRRAARRVGAADLAVPLVGLADDPKKVVEVVVLAHRLATGPRGPTAPA